jgi:hypothetical protein
MDRRFMISKSSVAGELAQLNGSYAGPLPFVGTNFKSSRLVTANPIAKQAPLPAIPHTWIG